MLVGPAKIHQRTVGGPDVLRERGRLKTWRAWSPVCVRGGDLAREIEIEPTGLDIDRTCVVPPVKGGGGLGDAA
jgi:hypothetical protein